MPGRGSAFTSRANPGVGEQRHPRAPSGSQTPIEFERESMHEAGVQDCVSMVPVLAIDWW